MICERCGDEKTTATCACASHNVVPLYRRGDTARTAYLAARMARIKKKHAKLAAEIEAIDALVRVDRPEPRTWEEEEEP